MILRKGPKLSNKLLAVVAIFICVSGCNLQFTDDGYPICSESSLESKSNKVFIAYYSINPQSFIVPSGKKYTVKEAFSEWEYTINHNGEINKEYSSQLVIVFKEQLDQSYFYRWKLGGKGSDIYFYPKANLNTLLGPLYSMGNVDSFYVDINDLQIVDSLSMSVGKLLFQRID